LVQTRRASRPPLRLGLLKDSVAYHIRRAQLSSFRRFALHVRSPGATPTQFATLVLVEENPGLSQVELGGTLDMDRATTMSVVDKLQQRRWLRRRRSTVDRRKHELRLTPTGAAALKKMKRAVLTHERQFGARLTPRQSRQLLGLLRRLLGE
jgi:DNA-binding MarR family transcriptional regulator